MPVLGMEPDIETIGREIAHEGVAKLSRKRIGSVVA